MASKIAFTPEEWNRILESVMLSGMAVTAADPSGLFGVLKESMATGRTLLEAKADPTSNELIRSVVSAFETSEGRQAARHEVQARLKGVAVGDMKEKSIAALHEVSQLLDSKAPADATGFKTWLRHIAEKKMPPRPRPRAASWALAARGSARSKRQLWPRSPKPSVSPPD